jgi:magnesium transporter
VDGVDVWWVSPTGSLEGHEINDLAALLERTDGFCWVDIPACDDRWADLLSEVFRVHPLAVRDCLEPNPTGKVHAYPDHILLVLHSPESGAAGQVHLVELDQLVASRYLVTVHGPSPEGCTAESALSDTAAVRARMETGRFCPATPAHLSHAIVSSLALRQERYVGALAGKVAVLERWALEGDTRGATAALEEMLRVRHEVLTVAKVAAVNSTVYARVAALPRFVSPDLQRLAEETRNQFEILHGMCNTEEKFLEGILDFYQSRTATTMNVAMERLALITVVMLPITAVASVYGMNIIVNAETDFSHLLVALVLMAGISALMLQWARRQGWW